MRLIDSHGHLQAKAFTDDATRVLADARAAGLERLMAPGWDAATSIAGIDLASELRVLTAVGFHPHVSADVTSAQREHIAGLASHPLVSRYWDAPGSGLGATIVELGADSAAS